MIGCGSSVYDTYQNVPRLSDKYLGECGSRRLAQRFEIDEAKDDAAHKQEEEDLKRHLEGLYALMQNPPKPLAPSVCDWTEPADTITILSGMQEQKNNMVLFGAAFLLAGAGWYYCTYMM